jgi:hypothetical protein
MQKNLHVKRKTFGIKSLSRIRKKWKNIKERRRIKGKEKECKM